MSCRQRERMQVTAGLWWLAGLAAAIMVLVAVVWLRD
jgi:hypothetical protein